MKIKNIEFNINIIRKNNKHMYLRVKGNDIIITCSKDIADSKIYDFIQMRQDWIYKQYFSQKDKQDKLTINNDKVYILGKVYDVKYDTLNNSISLSDALYIGNIDKTRMISEYDKFCEHLLDYVIKQLNDKWSNIFNRRPTITYKKMKSKWGICYTRENRIVLNINLVHFNIAAIESVLVHEYIHFFVSNHSKQYYDLLLAYMPDYWKRQQLLK